MSKSKSKTLIVDEKTHTKIKVKAAKSGKTIKQVLAEALDKID